MLSISFKKINAEGKKESQSFISICPRNHRLVPNALEGERLDNRMGKGPRSVMGRVTFSHNSLTRK